MRLVAAAAERWTHTVVVVCAPGGTYAGGLGIQERLGWFFSWDCRCCHTGHQLVSYFGPLHLHVQPSDPLLREKLDNALLGDQWIGN